jgi:hypothetical protein
MSTVQVYNDALKSTNYVGAWESGTAAEDWATSQAAQSRSFMCYRIHEGTSSAPGDWTGFEVRGSADPPPSARCAGGCGRVVESDGSTCYECEHPEPSCADCHVVLLRAEIEAGICADCQAGPFRNSPQPQE